MKLKIGQKVRKYPNTSIIYKIIDIAVSRWSGNTMITLIDKNNSILNFYEQNIQLIPALHEGSEQEYYKWLSDRRK